MKITIKHYDEKVSLSINEDQYQKHGLDETTSNEALHLCLKGLFTIYSEKVIHDDIIELAEDLKTIVDS